MSSCKVCGHPEDNHPFRHPFTSFNGSIKLESPKPPQTNEGDKSGDMIVVFSMIKRLCQVLVNKGLLKGEEAVYVLTGEQGVDTAYKQSG